MEDFIYHTYLQRFGEYELTKNTENRYYLTKQKGCDSTQNQFLSQIGFEVNFKGKNLVLYERK
jgi:hypothetical protein